ncbi:adiponectin receptor protein 2-like [Diadema antillarum]|uniref:adiponectin receptor protein 2-like n=1 Tax=Diadema antillarum TaxID=105358 RepID=UPI003A8880B2
MNQSPEGEHLWRLGSAEDADSELDPRAVTTSGAATPLDPTVATGLTNSESEGKVRRRRKKAPKKQTHAEDSDSDSMDPDPEVGGAAGATQDGQESNEQDSLVDQRVTDVAETTALKTKDADHPKANNSDKENRSAGSDSDLDFSQLQQRAAEQAQKFVQKVKDVTWKVTHHNFLPDWLKDNDFLHYHHRPPLPSFRTCFKSIFRIHTETGNIWTHMLGCLAFIIIMIFFLVKSIMSHYQWQEIVAYMMFFLGAILCLGFSCLFHTLYCHSVQVSRLFSKLDYSGITFLIVGSFVPWLYFGFYCDNIVRYCYLAAIIVLGILCLTVALRDSFNQPKYRSLRAGLYVALGLSGVIPAIHYVSINSFITAIEAGGLGWMILMACLYIIGAVLYAIRVPERFFPGKCDIWFQSHQIFHVLVLAAAFVHYHGINTMAAYREQVGECDAPELTTGPDVTVEV